MRSVSPRHHSSILWLLHTPFECSGTLQRMAAAIETLLDFTAFTHEIRNVKRAMWVKDITQYENDSEHSFQLAMIALYIIEENKLSLDTFKAMAIALVHDILEVHAGDTFVYGKDTVTQHDREAEAIQQLKKQWPAQKTMLALIDEYETKASAEATFIYALDKLVPILNNLLDNGRNWQQKHITLEQLIAVKTKKIGVDPVVEQYYTQVLDILRARPELFATKRA